MREKILTVLEDSGFRGELISIQRLPELKKSIDSLYQQGLLNQTLYENYFSRANYSPPPELPQSNTIVVVAIPQPISRVIFDYRGKTVAVLIAPTYIAKADIAKVTKLLKELLHPVGHRLVKALLPQKLVAARSGLGVYGRNNILYLPNGGSYFRLVTFFTDLPCPDDNWQDLCLMEQCDGCSICGRKCPSGAIPVNGNAGMVVNVERCLTFHNESQDDFPGWIKKRWHNALVGCMVCQEVCPANRDCVDNIVTVETFTAAETTLVLDACPQDKLPSGTREKLEKLDLVDYVYSLLPRNLKALL